MCAQFAQSRQTLCDPMDCSLPGSSVHGILQARVLEWVAVSFFNSTIYIFFIHSPVDRHLSCFNVLTVVNGAAMNTGVDTSLFLAF